MTKEEQLTLPCVVEADILNKMKARAEEEGYELTENAPKIARAKARFFGKDEWYRCPCDPNSDRYCISDHCKKDIEDDGICHCHCYQPQTEEIA